MDRRTKSQGQVLLITLLILTIATTVGLSLIGRTTTDININNQIEESARAFSAAEAGIEQVLRNGDDNAQAPVTISSDVSYRIVQQNLGSSTVYALPTSTTKGGTDVIWLTTHDAAGQIVEATGSDFFANPGATSLNLCWTTGSPVPAVVVSVIYKRGATYQVARRVFDSAARVSGSDVTVPTAIAAGCSASVNTAFRGGIDFAGLGIVNTDVVIMMRIRPLFNDAQFVVSAPVALPKQGNIYTSTGTTATGLNRSIEVYQSYSAPLSVFDYALYAQQDTAAAE